MTSEAVRSSSLVVRLSVVKYRYGQMLFDPKSKRAATELLSYKLPAGSTIALWRDGREIATAEVVHEGYSGHCGDFREVFMGEFFALIEPEAELMRSAHLPVAGRLYSSNIKAESLLVDDEIVLTIRAESLVPHGRKKWSLGRWYRWLTCRSRRAAYEEQFHTPVWEVINRLFESKYPGDPGVALSRFHQERVGASWMEALYDAVQQVGIPEPKTQTEEVVVARLEDALDRHAKVVVVLNSGRRLKGKIVGKDDHGGYKFKESRKKAVSVSVHNIRRVLWIRKPAA